MIHLRPYQQADVSAIRSAMQTHQSVLYQLPTGGGKTAIAAYIIYHTARKGNTVYFLCHRQELIEQTSRTFQKVGIDYISYIAAGYTYDHKCPVQICSVATLKNRLAALPHPSLIVWDECHHVASASWSKIKNWFCRSYHVGLSATPTRLDGRGLQDYFSYMVCGPTVSSLMEQGYLADYIAYAPSVPDLTGVKTTMGDYKTDDLSAAMDKSHITGNIIEHWFKLAKGKRTIGYAPSIANCKRLVDQLNAAGAKAIYLHGGSDKDERRAVATAFAKHEYDIIFNVDLFSEGYDLSAQAGEDVTVDAVILARPTKSLSLHLQQVGRCLRPKTDGSQAIILDHSGNCLTHGLPDLDRKWSLTSCKKTTKYNAEGDISVRQCPSCFSVHKPVPNCPTCGHEYIIKERKVEQREGVLTKLEKDKISQANTDERKKAHSLQSLIELGKKRGYKYPAQWAAKVWTARISKKRYGG